MDREGQHIQALGICNRFYNFIKFLPANVLKILTSGSLMPSRLAHARELKAAQIQASSSSSSKTGQVAATPTPRLEGANMEANKSELEQQSNGHITRRSCSDEQEEGGQVQDNDFDEEKTPLASNGAAKGPPKKMVSINDNVETITISKKKKGKKAKEEVVVEHSKPLKSILKVSSDLNNNNNNATTEMLLSRANGA